jgi:predicted amidohydrolase
MVVDPWGVVLAQAPDTECFVAADLDFAAQEEMRRNLPSLRNRRPRAYRWPDGDAGRAGVAAEIAEPTIPTGAP